MVDAGDFIFYDCAYEEMLQSLGPINDDESVPWTMFNDNVQMGFFDVYDQYLLNMLYHPRIRPGMNRAGGARRGGRDHARRARLRGADERAEGVTASRALPRLRDDQAGADQDQPDAGPAQRGDLSPSCQRDNSVTMTKLRLVMGNAVLTARKRSAAE